MSSSTSSNVKCPNCDGKEVELDSQMGHVVCIGCGTVLELNTMVSLECWQSTLSSSLAALEFGLE